MLNSSINFIIYCFPGSKFRETLLSSFTVVCLKSEIFSQAAPVHSVQVANLKNDAADHEDTEDAQLLEESVILSEEQLLLHISQC